MARRISESAWEQMRQLFLQGLSIRKVAAKTGTPPGSVAARASREKWSKQRRQLMILKRETVPSDTEGLIRAVVNENRLRTLECESKSARLLAERCLKAIEDGVPIATLADIEKGQQYRERLWPSVSPSIMPALEGAQRGQRLVVSEETKKYVEQLKKLM